MTTTWFDLLRHGEPDGGPRYRGHRDDRLSDLGWEQMGAAVRDDDHWDHILTSPLARCRAFAEALAAERGLPCTVEPGFKEISFGAWEGLTPEQVDERFGDSQARFWRDAERHSPDGGEPIQAFHERVGAAWRHWHQELAGQRVLLVCHGGVIRMVLAHVTGLAPGRALGAFLVPYANRSRVRLDRTEHGPLACLVQHGTLEPTP
ncbi:alpha-ribazole-5'-phosphate phosphatase [Alcanivorax sp. 521-1]|uniref:Alpha-ribazole-5'-phosphate phosphatase n=1 Tax=Alloalcanivorax profundimaris TaxID=2735259 RepID=A0ABS0AYS9_9GAMM|nr:histidine phosphatase family protein [Alloalcanivorax profundimaris]MBF5058480.1 alpha-ribazole-5'-phosphate phosphatase [Alloalcanivorax profundimaris]MBU59969.1 histidine phosphatase family protein [Alcanivorax sp.]